MRANNERRRRRRGHPQGPARGGLGAARAGPLRARGSPGAVRACRGTARGPCFLVVHVLILHSKQLLRHSGFLSTESPTFQPPLVIQE